MNESKCKQWPYKPFQTAVESILKTQETRKSHCFPDMETSQSTKRNNVFLFSLDISNILSIIFRLPDIFIIELFLNFLWN